MVINLEYPCLEMDNPDLWKPSKYQGEIVKIQYHTHWYSGNSATPFKKPICIYVPYGYDPLQDYDVMVLLPGMDMPYSCYLSRAQRYSQKLYSVYFKNVLDNLIASKQIKPLILVTLPYYGATIEGHPVMELDGNQLIHELRYDLLPYMIQNYSTYAKGTDSLSIANARDHFGIFGFSYTSIMIPKYIMPNCLDLFSWFGASSVFWSDLNKAIPEINELQKKYPINYFYIGSGDSDNAYQQTHDVYNLLVSSIVGLNSKSRYIVLPNTGHDARTYDTAIVNCLLRFFSETKSNEVYV